MRSVAITLFLSVAIACADDFDAWVGASPDKRLFAVVRRTPEPDMPCRLDLDGFAVFICTAEGHSIVAQHTFPRRLVSQIRWSPDSQFLLFTTVSSGGHSPWHVNTYLYCAADKSFRDVESAAHATVGATEFGFEPPDVVVLTVNEVSAEKVKQIKLPLGKTAKEMQRIP
jgi:dipeptidyl aminopeptidase/acylaminoacyl peptidase